MKVRDVMTVEVATAAPETPLEEVAAMMKAEDTGAIPVLDADGQVIGVVTDRDIVVRGIAEGMDPAKATVDEVLSGDLHTVKPDSDVEDAMRLMSRRQIRRLPVVENGELVGMLSLGDLAVKTEEEEMTARTLEQISEGVKATTPQGATKGGGKESAAGGVRKQSGSARKQGISNRRASQEKGRQQRVVPIRGERESGRRGGRKTG